MKSAAEDNFETHMGDLIDNPEEFKRQMKVTRALLAIAELGGPAPGWLLGVALTQCMLAGIPLESVQAQAELNYKMIAENSDRIKAAAAAATKPPGTEH